MKKTEKLKVMFRGQAVGTLSLTPDNRMNVFEYDKSWLANGFSISPLELPLKPGVFIAKPQPFYGNFGVFEDSLPDGYGRYLLHKTLLRKGINDSALSSLDRLAIVGDNGMGALTYSPAINLEQEENVADFDRLQQIALEVLKEQQDNDAGLLLYNSGNSGGARPKAIFPIPKDTGLSSSDISTTRQTWEFRNTDTMKSPGKAESMYLIFGLSTDAISHPGDSTLTAKASDFTPQRQAVCCAYRLENHSWITQIFSRSRAMLHKVVKMWSRCIAACCSIILSTTKMIIARISVFM